jgi:G3E family GTPase
MVQSAIAQAASPSVRDRARAQVRTKTTRPIYVIGGFLGSGKTTLLSHLLAHVRATGARPVVIMNEFAESSVDGRLLSEHDHRGELTLRELASGCVCCDLSQGLSSTVTDLLRATEGPIFIETTGLAVVERVAHAVRRALAPIRGEEVEAATMSVIAVVDALRFDLNQSRSPHVATDIAAADTVVVNKVDQASSSVLRGLRARIRALNAHARVVETSYGQVEPPVVLTAPARRARRPPLRLPKPPSGYSSVTCRPMGPIDVAVLESVLERYGDRLVRAKGFVRTTSRRGVCLLQWVPGALEVGPPARDVRVSRLVVIGTGIDWTDFVRDLGSAVVAPRRFANRRIAT